MDMDWKSAWESALKSKKIFPYAKNGDIIEVSCPTRFSSYGQFSIEIKPLFQDESIELEMLLFNDNIPVEDVISLDKIKPEYKSVSLALKFQEEKNRLLDRYTINSEGFETEDEAVNTLVDYINNKATESGISFDEKVDECVEMLENKKSSKKAEGLLRSIRQNRRAIFSKVENILRRNYRWRSVKSEEICDDCVAEFVDKDGNLAAVVSLVDDNLVVDLAKGVSSVVNMIQSDEDIEKEIVQDVEQANDILAKQEIEDLKDVVAGNPESHMDDVYDVETDDRNSSKEIDLRDLEKRLTKLENLYIRNKLYGRR